MSDDVCLKCKEWTKWYQEMSLKKGVAFCEDCAEKMGLVPPNMLYDPSTATVEYGSATGIRFPNGKVMKPGKRYDQNLDEIKDDLT